MCNVVVGAFGSLQPRVYIRCDGMRVAEALEQTGSPNLVHVDEIFLDMKRMGAMSASTWRRRWIWWEMRKARKRASPPAQKASFPQSSVQTVLFCRPGVLNVLKVHCSVILKRKCTRTLTLTFRNFQSRRLVTALHIIPPAKSIDAGGTPTPA
jgi:hypothetical protein